jgi:3-oxoadipate enol-lactonase
VNEAPAEPAAAREASALLPAARAPYRPARGITQAGLALQVGERRRALRAGPEALPPDMQGRPPKIPGSRAKPPRSQRKPEPRETTMAEHVEPTRSGFIHPDGYDIYYEYFGTGEREPVALLNGLAMSTKAWYPFLPRLLDEFDVLLYDYPGQGESSKPDAPTSITRIADYLTLVMDHLGVEKLHSMGISYGGFIALEHARLYHPRLLTLTLSGIILSREELFEMYEAMSLRFYRGGPELFGLYTHYLYEKIFGEAFVRRMTIEGLEPMRQRFEERYRDQIYCLVRLTEAQEEFFSALKARMPEYRSVTTPTLVMPGAQDRAIPLWAQKKLLDVFPNSRWLLVPEAGHVVYLERPDVFFSTLKAFMRARSTRFPSLLTSA